MKINQKPQNGFVNRFWLSIVLASLFSPVFLAFASGPDEGEAKSEKPSPPQLLEPADLANIDCRKRKTASVILKWQKVEGDVAYHLELCQDGAFTQWVVDQKPLLATEIEYPDLPPGSYFWRVSTISQEHVEGLPSVVSQFQVVPGEKMESAAPEIDTTPPKLKLKKPSIHGRFVIVTGSSEKTASVWVNGKVTVLDIDTGKFVYIASMTSAGIHKIHVMAHDPAGNVARKSLTVEIKE